MSEDKASRLVEERNSSRNSAPAVRPAGVRFQLEETPLSRGVVPLLAVPSTRIWRESPSGETVKSVVVEL